MCIPLLPVESRGLSRIQRALLSSFLSEGYMDYSGTNVMAMFTSNAGVSTLPRLSHTHMHTHMHTDTLLMTLPNNSEAE